MKKPQIALHIMHAMVVAAIAVSVAPATTVDLGTQPPPPPISYAQAQLREVTDGLVCTGEKEPRLTNRVFVLDTITDKVYEVTFDKAVKIAGDGTHQILAYCN